MKNTLSLSRLKFWNSPTPKKTTGPKTSPRFSTSKDRVSFSSRKTTPKTQESLPTQAGWGTLGAVAGLALGVVGGALTGVTGLALVAGVGLAVAGGYGAMHVADKVQGIDRPPLTPEQEKAQIKRLNNYIEENNRRLLDDDFLFAP